MTRELGVAAGMLGLALVLVPFPGPAAAAQTELAEVIAFAGSGAVVLRNGQGHEYGLVYVGMAGSQPAQDAFAGFHEFASQAHGQRVMGQAVRVEPTGVVGVTTEGMAVLAGHAFLPGATVPVAADVLGDGLGWYQQDPNNAFDGLYAELEVAARASHHGVWGWSTAVPYLGATPPPAAPPDFLPSPLPLGLQPAWDALVSTRAGQGYVAAVRETATQFRLAHLGGAWAVYLPARGLVSLDAGLEREDPRATATVLAHEITHVLQAQQPPRDCVQDEVEAFANQSSVWAELTGPEPPTGTRLEKQLTLVRRIYEQLGRPGLALLVVGQPGYQEQCGLAA